MDALAKDSERVCKKQKVCALKTLEGVERLLSECVETRNRILALQNSSAEEPTSSAGNAGDEMEYLHELQRKVHELDFLQQITSHQKDFQGALAKLKKTVDKHFLPDVSKALRDQPFDKATLNEVIVQHLLREGKFELGEQLMKDAIVQLPDGYKDQYIQMHQVLEQMSAFNLKPAIQWTQERRVEADTDALACLEFKLHRLQFVQLLHKEGRAQALSYARAHLSTFASQQMREIERLMGCLLYANRLDRSPYADLLSPGLWDEIRHEFSRMCCSTLGQAQESPLGVAVSAGTIALPTLLKLVSVMQAKTQPEDWNSCQQLPVEIALGEDFAFHSVFACPVSRDQVRWYQQVWKDAVSFHVKCHTDSGTLGRFHLQATADNPPMLMPCGHVLCKVSLTKLAKGGGSRPFKCPYCPGEATVQQCKQLYL
uniref:LisH domain-containing protein n=1 Tax=Pyramimonas obovata TaxID=1411642 RepID=A0A7S0MZH4_9CHLO